MRASTIAVDFRKAWPAWMHTHTPKDHGDRKGVRTTTFCSVCEAQRLARMLDEAHAEQTS